MKLLQEVSCYSLFYVVTGLLYKCCEASPFLASLIFPPCRNIHHQCSSLHCGFIELYKIIFSRATTLASKLTFTL